MFYTLFYILSLLTSTLFSFMKHPLAMGFMLLIQTFLICLMTGTLLKSFWFSYILFLIFIGGMLVLFIYVTSLASNEMFSFSSKTFLIMMSFLIVLLSFFLLFDKTMFMNNFKPLEIFKIQEQMSFFSENNLLLNKLYNFPTNMISILLMIYLFFTLIAVVKITNIFEGALRPKFF